MGLFVGGLIVRQPQAELAGYPAVLSCGRDPVEPVSWTFHASPHRIVKYIKSSKRVGIRGSYLIIYSVKEADNGSYVCIDAALEPRRTIQLSVLGKCLLSLVVSCHVLLSVVLSPLKEVDGAVLFTNDVYLPACMSVCMFIYMKIETGMNTLQRSYKIYNFYPNHYTTDKIKNT